MSLTPPVIAYNYVSKETDEPSELYEIVLNVSIPAEVLDEGVDYVLEYGIFEVDPTTNVINATQWCDKGIEAFSTSQQGIINQVSLRVTTDKSYGQPLILTDGQYVPNSYVIMVRYILSDGLTSAWSLPLSLKPPYQKPFITFADWSDLTGYTDRIYVNIDPSNLDLGDFANYPFENIKAILTVHAATQETSGSTSWATSQPLTATKINNYYQYEFDTGLNVSSQYIYVVANLVYSITNTNDDYNVISYTSNTYEAAAKSYEAAVLEPVDYLVYNAPPYPGDQIMNLSWISPETTYIIESYTVQGSTNSLFNTIDYSDTVLFGTNTTSFNINEDCGTTLYWRVLTNYSSGTVTTSNVVSENIFYYPTVPQNVNVTSSTFDEGTNTFSSTVTFTNVSSVGCGSNPAYIVQLIDANNTVVETDTVIYNESTPLYTVNFNNVNYTNPTYFVKVFLRTDDTNNEGVYRFGPSVQVINSPTELLSIDYLVYNVPPYNNTQIMVLDWQAPSTSSGITILNYNVMVKSTPSGPFVLFQTVANTVTELQCNVSTYSCGTTLEWMIITNFSDGVQTQSNTLSKNIFIYPTQPSNLSVLYSAFNTLMTSFDTMVEFENPTSTGCGAPQNFVLNMLKDGSVVDTVNVNYDADANIYTASFDNTPYTEGSSYAVNCFLTVEDTNSSNILDGPSNQVSVYPIDVPYIPAIEIQPTINNNNLESVIFKVISGALLGRTALITCANRVNGLSVFRWLTSPGTNSISTLGTNVTSVVSRSEPIDNTYIYDVALTFNPVIALNIVSNSFTISASNSAGEGHTTILP